MTDIDTIYRQTFDDRRLSRSERRALSELVADHDEHTLAMWRHRAFAFAHEQLVHASHPPTPSESAEVLAWLEDVVKTLAHVQPPPAPATIAESHFSPGTRPRQRINGLLESAQRSVDICVFTITDNRIADVIVATHQRGVRVRVVSDGNKASDLGSDVCDLLGRGIEVRTDDSDAHMHHKFALFDDRVLLTGSYNWTRSAALENQENVLVTDDHRIIEGYRIRFHQLWDSLEDATATCRT